MGSAGGTPSRLYLRVERQIPDLSRRIAAALVEEVPEYRNLPREALSGEIFEVITENLRLFFRLLREQRGPVAGEMLRIRESAVRRAEEGIALDAVLRGYELGARLAWQALVVNARLGEPGDLDEQAALLAVPALLVGYLRAVTAAVCGAYLDEQQAIFGEERDADRALAHALLTGQEVAALALRLGVLLPPAQVVLVCHLAAHPDELDSGVEAAVAARRKLRRVTERLTAFAGGRFPSLLDPEGGVALLPAEPSELPAAVAGVRQLVAELQAVAGSAVTAGLAAAASRAGLPVAAAQAREVLRIVLALDWPPGGYQLDDVLLEYQLTRPSEAQPMLAAVLEPLRRHPDLLDTLCAYLEHDLDRRSTARAVHVHPNTLDYRLRRISELIGTDVSSVHGLQLCGAALAAFRLRNAEATGPAGGQ